MIYSIGVQSDSPDWLSFALVGIHAAVGNIGVVICEMMAVRKVESD